MDPDPTLAQVGRIFATRFKSFSNWYDSFAILLNSDLKVVPTKTSYLNIDSNDA